MGGRQAFGEGIGTATGLDERGRAQVARMLRAGYGIEDIAVKTGLDEAEVRSCVRYWQRSGDIWKVLPVNAERHREALRIMGAVR